MLFEEKDVIYQQKHVGGFCGDLTVCCFTLRDSSMLDDHQVVISMNEVTALT